MPESLRVREIPERLAFNEEDLMARLMGDRRLAGSVLKLFLGDFPTQLNRLRVSLDETGVASDNDVIEAQLHKMKGAAATVGADGLCALALAMELAKSAGEMDRCRDLVPRAAEEFERFRTMLACGGWL